MKVLILNGPNLNFLGIREKEIYGTATYKEACRKIRNYAKKKGVRVKIRQSNDEGKLIGWIQKLLGNDPEKIRKMELKHRLEIIEIEKSQLQMQEQKAEDMEYKYQQALSRKKAAELEIHEIEQAIKAIEEAGRSIQNTFGQELNEKISKIFSDVTNGKYTKVVMDDSLRMMVYDGFDYIDMKYLDQVPHFYRPMLCCHWTCRLRHLLFSVFVQRCKFY